MPDAPQLWMRHEARDSEHRAPIVPADAARLLAAGLTITVEDSPQRAFPTADYAAVGCRIAPAGSWPQAPADTYILGLKELPGQPWALRHRHIFFSHSFQRQHGSRELLRRFADGGGVILDLEYLTDAEGRRLAAFGYWAGYVGAALAVLHRRGVLRPPLRPGSRAALDRLLAGTGGSPAPTALVIGALGRCGTGAREALATAGVRSTDWDLPQTRHLDRAALLDHEVLVNAVLVRQPVPPFVRVEDLASPHRRLSVIADVTCDVASPHHTLPVYRHTTTWHEPVAAVSGAEPPLDVIALDNLPSLLPRESSAAFSADLMPHLAELGRSAAQWDRCLRRYHEAVDALGIEGAP
ncbi:saccharopine dehydrogenase [Micromonospora sp. KC213]|uniref:saccharopine dehydrogenase n=1 Tax=Micromonospora sp. KC213 TaxID=2530378 RepID=UPI00104AE8D8|nr:saccharopine dehydrogenase [Micromonospora sp. KC213]TDC42688.1 saccharopine dehydrogenase [Micromonospora sp. KC213]